MQKFLLKVLVYTAHTYLHKVLSSDIVYNYAYCIEMLGVLLMLYNGLFSFGADFPNSEALDLAEFSWFQIYDPNIRKTYVSNTSHKVYMCTCMSV